MAAFSAAIKIRLCLLLNTQRGPGQGLERGCVCVVTGIELSVGSLAKIAVINGKYLHLGFKASVFPSPSPLSQLR